MRFNAIRKGSKYGLQLLSLNRPEGGKSFYAAEGIVFAAAKIFRLFGPQKRHPFVHVRDGIRTAPSDFKHPC
jgi:hypothetical protein